MSDIHQTDVSDAHEAPRRRGAATAIVVLVLVVVAAAVAWYSWKRPPRYALREAADAYREHDLDRLEKYVDVHSFSRSMSDSFIFGVVEGAKDEDFDQLISILDDVRQHAAA